MEDYDFLHDDPNSVTKYYIQSTFLNNEISKMKTPTVLAKQRMVASKYESLSTSLENYSDIGYKDCLLVITNVQPETFTFDILIYPQFNNEKAVSFNGKFATVHCESPFNLNPNLLDTPATRSEFKSHGQELNDIKIYITQDAPFEIDRCATRIEK